MRGKTITAVAGSWQATPVIPLLLLLAGQVDPRAEELTIDQAIAIADQYANEIIRAQADVLLVDVERGRAIGAVLPTVGVSIASGGVFAGDPIYEARDPRTFNIARFEPEGSFSESFFRPAITLRQLVFDGGRWWLTIARADDIELQRDAALDVVRNDVRLNVVRQFYGLERAQQTVATFRHQMELSEDQLERAKKQSDLATAQRNLAEDRVQFARREFAADEARRSLNLAIGRDARLPVKLILPDRVVTATVAVPPIDLPPATALIDRAMKVRPEVIRSRATLEVIKKNIGIRTADLWPRLTVGAAYRKGWYGAGNRTLGDALGFSPTENYFITLDATLSWNLFEGLQTKLDIEEAEIALRRAISDHEALERMVAREVDSRAQNLSLQMAIYDLARDGAASAGEAVRLARTLFTQGKGSALELRDAELKSTQSKLQAINARLDVEVAIEELRRAVGEPVLPQ
jgi:outer membrane protein